MFRPQRLVLCAPALSRRIMGYDTSLVCQVYPVVYLALKHVGRGFFN